MRSPPAAAQPPSLMRVANLIGEWGTALFPSPTSALRGPEAGALPWSLLRGRAGWGPDHDLIKFATFIKGGAES